MFYVKNSEDEKTIEIVNGEYFTLTADNWNDHGYRTLFRLDYTKNQDIFEIGLIKILHFRELKTIQSIPRSFEELGNQFISLGSEESFYTNLIEVLGLGLANEVLLRLNDIAILNIENHYNFKIEYDGVQKSLLRSDLGLNPKLWYLTIKEKYFSNLSVVNASDFKNPMDHKNELEVSEMNDYCFVIQPFDYKYNKRYEDVFKPAIIAMRIKPYRVDEDPSVIIPIDSIEEKIKNSKFCLADISMNNPNVWYEVGFAYALGKDVILVSEKQTQYPFDIRHRNVIAYDTDSAQDFTILKESIIRRGKAILSKKSEAKKPLNKEVMTFDDCELTNDEVVFVSMIIQHRESPNDGCSVWLLKSELKNNNLLNELGFGIASTQLLDKEFITTTTEADYNGQEYTAYLMTEKGNTWITNNISRIYAMANFAESLPF